jgi:group I intron endonuclease
MIYDVYTITCLSNEKVYFGRSQEVEKRWRSHKNMFRKSQHNNTLMQDDWNQFGEDSFLFEVVYTTEIIEDAISVEQMYIDSSDYDSYNISDASMGGDTFTNNPRKEEIRKLKSLQSSGERNGMYGKPKSEKMLQRVKEANSKPVIIEGVRYSSITEASKAYGVIVSTACYRIKAETFKEWNYE